MSSPLLSIAVPTYNRAHKIGRLLESLLLQVGSSLPGELEIVISDNCSSDDTAQIVSAYGQKMPIRYARNHENLGFDGNLRKLLELSRGKFVWFMGDDDRIEDAFLPKICELLRQDAVDFVIVPDRREDWEPSQSLASQFGVTRPLIAPLSDFLNLFGLFGVLGGLGHCLFRRSAVLPCDQLLHEKSSFLHVFMLARSFYSRTAVFITQPGFVVPLPVEEENRTYFKRWTAEGLWVDGWYCGWKHLMALVEEQVLKPPFSPNFFRMMYSQDWPFHFHVYTALTQKIFVRGETIPDTEWEKLAIFDNLLGASPYSALLSTIHREAIALRSIRERVCQMIAHPISIYPAFTRSD